MIDFSGYTYRNLLSSMLARIDNSFDKRDTSPIPTALSPAAYTFEEFYMTLNLVQNSAFVQSAVGQSLDYLAAVGGITRYPASAAVRLGVFNTAVPIGARFSTINGSNSINFAVTAATETANQYQLTAETAGSIGNDYSGAILPITTIPGLVSAQITDILIPGDDTETDDELRERLIEALNERPFAGNIAAYRADILAIDGVGAVQVYPTWNGGGTVKCVILGADLLPASSELIENVQQAIDPPTSGSGLGLAPIGAQVTIATATEAEIDVAASLTLMPGYDIEQVRPLVQAQIEGYLAQVRSGWDTQLGSGNVEYGADVYLSRVTAAIVASDGVANATNITLNGAAQDVSLTQSASVSQIPVLGTVTLSV